MPRSIYAGKGPGCHTLDQTTINALLITHARQGKVVTRLKGGDPFIFGRGGEEALALAAAAIPFEIVPGVTAAIAVPAYAGIPVTQRGQSSAVTIVTGHEGTSINWEALARLGGTIVIMMGVAALPAITARLLAAALRRRRQRRSSSKARRWHSASSAAMSPPSPCWRHRRA